MRRLSAIWLLLLTAVAGHGSPDAAVADTGPGKVFFQYCIKVLPDGPERPQWEALGGEALPVGIETTITAPSGSSQAGGRTHGNGQTAGRQGRDMIKSPNGGIWAVSRRGMPVCVAWGNPGRAADFFVFFIERLRL